MSAQRKATRTRIIEAALQLFAQKGVTETTTKEVAELAQVNEVTLFRHFGSKHGLLLAVIEDSAVFAQMGKALVAQVEQANRKSISQTFKDYAEDSLEALEQVPELVCSVVGEAGHYPLENRLALGQGLTQANNYIAQYLAKAIANEGWHCRFPPEKLASLLNGLLLGYFIIKSTSEGNALWERQEDFLESLVELFLTGAIAPVAPLTKISRQQEIIADLPANLVRLIMQRGKKLGKQEYALAYVLFGAGLSADEVASLERSHLVKESEQHILQINNGAVRQVPLNQWIMGKRYGSSSSNPLAGWLKSRKDDQAALFIDAQEQSLSQQQLQILWQTLTEGLLTPSGQPPKIEQARQTWCVEMLGKGISLENLSILSGMTVEQLQPYAQRAREKAALEQAHHLDQKN